MTIHSILLKGGTVLLHNMDDVVTPHQNTDLLIVGNKIAKIGKTLTAPAGAQIVNCVGKIVSPGFIDTHHHLWQTQLKSRHEDHTLFEYCYSGSFQSYCYEPKDVFWGQLGGALEAIDAGTTTVVDHGHFGYSAKHVNMALSATVSSGLRCFFCYTPIMRIQSWTSEGITPDSNFLPESFIEHLEELSSAQPFGDGRVHLGLGFDLYFLPKETVISLFERARGMGIKLITSHYAPNQILGKLSVPAILHEYGLLKPDILIAHASQATKKDSDILTAAGVYVSVTPETESQMALGLPAAFRSDMPLSLGVDCHITGPADLPYQMRLSLGLARQAFNQPLLDADLAPVNIPGTSMEAFNLGTIAGARAVRMESEIGSLVEGKLADIVIFNAMSPGMICAAQKDPVAAIVRHASIRDVEGVIVDGVVRKLNGSLMPVIAGRITPTEGKGELSWSTIAGELAQSMEEIDARIMKLDMSAGAESMIQLYGIEKTKLVGWKDHINNRHP